MARALSAYLDFALRALPPAPTSTPLLTAAMPMKPSSMKQLTALFDPTKVTLRRQILNPACRQSHRHHISGLH